jgi:hypothetical protein
MTLFYGPRANAFTDGSGWATVSYLAQILAENIKHYYQMKMLIEDAQRNHDYIRLINSGLDNSIGMLESLPIKDEKLLSELKSFRDAAGKVTEIYGQIPKSPEEALQMLHDNTIAESLRMVNSFKDYSEVQETNSQRIAVQSRDASPKGAMRMQAETSAQILNSMSQLIRLNTQMLKLQSEQLGMSNKLSKDSVSNYQQVTRDLGKSFQGFSPEMKLIKF